MKPSTWCKFGWHEWTRWENYTWAGKVSPTPLYVGHNIPQEEWPEVTQNRKKRNCLVCGLPQDSRV